MITCTPHSKIPQSREVGERTKTRTHSTTTSHTGTNHKDENKLKRVPLLSQKVGACKVISSSGLRYPWRTAKIGKNCCKSDGLDSKTFNLLLEFLEVLGIDVNK